MKQYKDGHKILIVDDEPDNIRILAARLRDMYTIVVATDGRKALEYAAADNQPSLILLDIMMPGKPVTEVVKQIKVIKIAFMSVVRISEARKKGLCTQDNIIDFIQKPFDVGDLVGRVELVLGE